MEQRKVGVCLLGCGTVGGGVASILREQHDMLRTRTGIDFELRHVVVKGPRTSRPTPMNCR